MVIPTLSRRALVLATAVVVLGLAVSGPAAVRAKCTEGQLEEATLQFVSAENLLKQQQWAQALPQLQSIIDFCPEFFPALARHGHGLHEPRGPRQGSRGLHQGHRGGRGQRHRRGCRGPRQPGQGLRQAEEVQGSPRGVHEGGAAGAERLRRALQPRRPAHGDAVLQGSRGDARERARVVPGTSPTRSCRSSPRPPTRRRSSSAASATRRRRRSTSSRPASTVARPAAPRRTTW